MAAALEPVFNAMCNTAGVQDNFRKFLITQKLTTAEDFALVASAEADVKDITAAAESAGIKFEAWGDKTALKKLWRACRALLDSKQASAAGTSAATCDDPVPPETITDMKEEWERRHDFVIMDNHFLVPSIQGRMWRGLQTTPPTLDVTLCEALRPMSCADRNAGTVLAVISNKGVEANTIQADAITRAMEVYCRTRAWFFTMAFLCVRRRDFFDLQHAYLASERIFGFVQASYNGFTPPTSFFTTAWASTVLCWAETMRTAKGCTLNALVDNAAMWEHRWQGYTPPQSSSNSASSSSNSVPDLPKHVQEEMDLLRVRASRWQSEVDKLRKEAERKGNARNQEDGRQERARNSGNGGGNGSGGGGRSGGSNGGKVGGKKGGKRGRGDRRNSPPTHRRRTGDVRRHGGY